MVDSRINRNTALLVRAVLFSLGIAGTSSCSAQAPIIDSSQSSSAYGQSQPESSGANYDVTGQLRQLQQEVMQLRGMVEEQAFQIQQLQQRQQPQSSASQPDAASSNSMSANPAEEVSADAQGASAPVAASQSSEPITADSAVGDEEAYRSAYNLIKAQKFDQAAEAFNAFTKNYPGSRYEPNAYYWLGELYLQTQDLDASFAAYSKLVDNFPDNSRVADARYKLAKVYFLKGDKTQSRDLLKKVIASYPSTSTAQAAQKFLKENF